jgi:hypothetical protein
MEETRGPGPRYKAKETADFFVHWLDGWLEEKKTGLTSESAGGICQLSQWLGEGGERLPAIQKPTRVIRAVPASGWPRLKTST